MTKAKGPLGGEVFRLIKEGREDAEIIEAFKHVRVGRVRLAISIARDTISREPPKRRGPWPVSYVRPNGEPVYRVGTGHDVPASSLAALGFRL
jgi:hypothetical protein